MVLPIVICSGVEWRPEGRKDGTWWGHICSTSDGFAIIRDVTHTQAKLLGRYSNPQGEVVEAKLMQALATAEDVASYRESRERILKGGE